MQHRPANVDKIPFRNGDEQDALGEWRKYYRFHTGTRTKRKRSYWKRLRQIVRRTIWTTVE